MDQAARQGLRGPRLRRADAGHILFHRKNLGVVKELRNATQVTVAL